MAQKKQNFVASTILSKLISGQASTELLSVSLGGT